MKTSPPGKGRAITEMIMTGRDEGRGGGGGGGKMGTRRGNGVKERQTDKGRVMGRE